MRNLRYLSIVFLLVLLLVPTGAHAIVSLDFVDLDAGPLNDSVTVLPGGTFNVRLNLVATNATTDRTTALNYYLSVLPAGSGLFSIQDRNIAGSTFSDTYFEDTGDGILDGVQVLPSALLDPKNNHDLGASVANANTPNLNGTFLVAVFTIKVDPATPFGTYSLQTTSDGGTGWVGASPDFADAEFSSHADYSIVVPEPTGLAACGAICLILGRRRSRA